MITPVLVWVHNIVDAVRERIRRTKLDKSFYWASAISSQVPLADREPQPSLRVCDMDDSWMLVAEEPDGCLDEFAPPHT